MTNLFEASYPAAHLMASFFPIALGLALLGRAVNMFQQQFTFLKPIAITDRHHRSPSPIAITDRHHRSFLRTK